MHGRNRRWDGNADDAVSTSDSLSVPLRYSLLTRWLLARSVPNALCPGLSQLAGTGIVYEAGRQQDRAAQFDQAPSRPSSGSRFGGSISPYSALDTRQKLPPDDQWTGAVPVSGDRPHAYIANVRQ